MYTALLLFGFFIFKKEVEKTDPKNQTTTQCTRLRQADINLLEREDARRLGVDCADWTSGLIPPMSLDPGTSDVSLLAMETALSPSSHRWMTTAWTSWTGCGGGVI